MQKRWFLELAREIRAGTKDEVFRPDAAVEVSVNPMGDKTIQADKRTEDAALAAIRKWADGECVPVAAVCEETGIHLFGRGKPAWLFVLDPVDGSGNVKKGIDRSALGIAVARVGRKKIEEVDVSDMEEAAIFVSNAGKKEEFYWRKGGPSMRNGEACAPSTRETLEGARVPLDLYEKIGTPVPPDMRRKLTQAVADSKPSDAFLVDASDVASGKANGVVATNQPVFHAPGIAMLIGTCSATLLDTEGAPARMRLLEVDGRVTVFAAGSRKMRDELLSLAGKERKKIR